MKFERGESFAEVVVTVAIAGIATAAFLGMAVVAAHRFGPDANTTALRIALQREMRVALDVMKYQGNAIVPTTIATSIPVPGSSPLGIHLSVTTSHGASATIITLGDSLDSDPSENASLSTTMPVPAPLPSSTVTAAGNAPQ